MLIPSTTDLASNASSIASIQCGDVQDGAGSLGIMEGVDLLGDRHLGDGLNSARGEREHAAGHASPLEVATPREDRSMTVPHMRRCVECGVWSVLFSVGRGGGRGGQKPPKSDNKMIKIEFWFLSAKKSPKPENTTLRCPKIHLRPVLSSFEPQEAPYLLFSKMYTQLVPAHPL